MTSSPTLSADSDALLRAVRAAARQEQFLQVVSAETARERFQAQVKRGPLGAERVALTAALGRVLADDLVAPVDAPPFDRSSVDGFAVRAADTLGASEGSPRRLRLNREVLVCGAAPHLTVEPGTATTIATGGVAPRGADAVVMIEWTDLIETAGGPAIELTRTVNPGQFIAYAGSDIARGETLLRRGARVGSREVAILAACGLAEVDVVRRPRVAVLSTGDELATQGEALRVGQVYDSNAPAIAAAVAEVGGEPVVLGIVADDEAALLAALSAAVRDFDIVVLSGGTSKGAGDLSHRVVSRLGAPGILVHGVALKPGKPLCLAAVGDKPLAVLPGFPTSAIFTFHAFLAPVIRAQAGLPPEAARTVEAVLPMRVPSELGRKEFLLVAVAEGEGGLVAFPSTKGSGAVTAFSQSDGFVEIDALSAAVDAGTRMRVTLLSETAELPDLVIAGSHCVALDAVLGALTSQGLRARTLAIGSQGGVLAAQRGECDLAPVHLLDPATGRYNQHLAGDGLTLVRGWERMQGIVHRRGDARCEGRSAGEALATLLADPHAVMVNRNAGAGTRILIDQLLGSARPVGYGNQPRSHNAVAAAVAQGRADWGVAISSVAALYGLGFLPLAPEHYDFLLVEDRRDRPAVRAFLSALADPETRARIEALGMTLPAA
ncbi:MAG: molybdopterin biosynthesis protein [Variibacter sp.]|nr:molybdopterin biosynthesis protein [Variibacter sp.]